MKKIRMNQLGKGWRTCCLLFALLASLVGCHKDELEETPVGGDSDITLNGGPYSNVTAKATDLAIVVYDPQQNTTAISYTATVNGQDILVVIAYPGNKAGQETWAYNKCFAHAVHQFANNRVVTSTYIGDKGITNSGYVKVTDYGQPGGIVAGSFEGTASFMDTECGCVTTGTMKGNFRGKRAQ
jgi:hypothetical protein